MKKAVVYTDYGSPDVLQLTEVEKPAPGSDEVLMNVHTASVNVSELTFMRDGRDQGQMRPKTPPVPDERRFWDKRRQDRTPPGHPWRTLAEWTFPSEPSIEREVIEQLGNLAGDLHVPTQRLEQLKTAVAEATMNAIEHGNHYRRDLPVLIQVRASPTAFAVRITDQGMSQSNAQPDAPDLEAKLAGFQSPRGWGLFLIKNLVDEVHVSNDEAAHAIELILYKAGSDQAHEIA
jgi:anti-sigma regulatory factor (Ser/Thr protein kinase)